MTPRIADIRQFSARELNPLLLEETAEWDRELDWDFSKSADLVRKFADSRGLGGIAMLDRSEVVGYGYTVLEDHKGLIGDVYVRPGWRTPEAQPEIFRVLLDTLMSTPGVRRVESQLMLLDTANAKTIQRERFIRIFERLLMILGEGESLAPGRPQRHERFYIEPWADHHHDSAATVISLAYTGHIDAQINDQYQTFQGARRFLNNIVQFPGCGAFHRPASRIAFEIATGWPAGVVLSSFVAPEVAHITQLCVTPHAQGTGLGYELLRQAIQTLRQAGARRISLTVTAANTSAVMLYRRCGFRDVRRFFAYVWELR
ncbi:MAG: GNAT family N-acetyltransferase [Acidobacteriota bacterium]|nr:GNAT family N-acetyltransferase [Acidobacteriota bacterium]